MTERDYSNILDEGDYLPFGRSSNEQPQEIEGVLVHAPTTGFDSGGNPTKTVKIEFKNPRFNTQAVSISIWPEDTDENRHVRFQSSGEFDQGKFSFPVRALDLALEQLGVRNRDDSSEN